jgi:hypothetical protein
MHTTPTAARATLRPTFSSADLGAIVKTHGQDLQGSLEVIRRRSFVDTGVALFPGMRRGNGPPVALPSRVAGHQGGWSIRTSA